MTEGDELLGQLEGDDAPERMTAEAVGALWLDLADFRQESGGQVFDPGGVRLLRARFRIEKPKERLFRLAPARQLVERERMGRRSRDRKEGSCEPLALSAITSGRSGAAPQHAGEDLGQLFDRGSGQERFQGEVLAQVLVDLGEQPCRQQRVAAELEEVVIDPDGTTLGQLFPDRDQLLFQLGPRPDDLRRVAPTRAGSGAGKPLRSILPLGVKRHRVEPDEGGRDRGVGEPLLEEIAKRP